MNREKAKELIKDTFESPFDKEKFVNFIKNLLNKIEEKPFTYQGNYIPDAFKPYISRLERIGKYTDGENEIDLLIVNLKRGSSLERARTTQRNFIAWYLKGSRGGKLKDAALVAFVSPDGEDWRFSLVKIDYSFVKGESGRVKVKEEFTPARRWSFLVGKNERSHTAQSRLVPILEDDEHNPTLAQLEEAFNVEPVTKEFFEKYRDLLIRTVDALDKIVEEDKKIKKDFESKGINTVDFAKKLLGQIVFLYFLQKKGLFGVERDAEWGTGAKDFLRRLFNKEYGGYANFFNDILEPLFYEALARERDDNFYSRFYCKIPFLNGGLFEPIGGYDWVHTDIVLPDNLFSNNRRTSEGDVGDGILDIFDRFNFTVKEDEPLEKEVAIDPELLGKLYEKFNAIRPDNFYEYKKALASGKRSLEKQFNKKFGVYYTPREIVHYMCQQSLLYYLSTELEGKVSEEDIEKLIKFGEQFTENETVVEERGKETSTYKYRLPESIRKNARLIDEKLRNIKICDPAVGSGAFPVGMMHEIVKTRNVLSAFINGPKRSIYNFKRECIENSLYGVDIDAGACEVAKLRLWLSLIVDEEDIRKIKPLPNLDYKIVCGNSLLSLPEDVLLNDELNRKIEEKKNILFYATSPYIKERLRSEINRLFAKQINFVQQFDPTIKDLKFDFRTHFSEVFRQKGGFNVVIANPPYIDSEEMVRSGQKELREYICRRYIMTKGNWDIYIAFFELSFRILNSNGVISFITPDKWLSKPFGYELRSNTISKLYSILRSGREVFEYSKVDSIISIFTNNIFDKIKILDFRNNNIVFLREVCKKILKPPYNLDFLFSKNLPLILKIENIPTTLKKYGYCENACATSDAYKLKPLIKDLSKEQFNSEKHLKVINTGTIGSYVSKWGKVKMTYLREKYKFPTVEKKEFFKAFNETYINRAIKPKIIIKGLTLLEACLDSEGVIIPGKSTLIVLSDKINSLKFLLAIINCKLATFYIQNRYPSSSYNEGINFTKSMINELPIPQIKRNQQKVFIDIVDKILSIMQTEDYLENPKKQARIKEYEHKIDQMVYKLYELTDEEIKIVEGEVK